MRWCSGLEHEGTGGPAGAAGDAITVGFGLAAVVFAVALLVGIRLLPRTRVADEDAQAVPLG
ncbi:MAG: hypothetical protein AB7J32_10960 [Pseudonocardia sp.]